MNKILSPYTKDRITLKNHLVMAPMTRSRAVDNIPNELMVEYYSQRTGAGLIITEGTAPTPEALGYPRIPGIFSHAQVEGWQKVTEAVHAGGSRIFLQLMHTGRIGHYDNLPDGARLVGASGIKAAGQIFTDRSGMQEHSSPTALTADGIAAVIEGHVQAARNSVEAGFDGIELHGANGYLIEQFLNPNVNSRTDEYGGSIKARAKLAVDLAKHIADAIGKEKVGIRVSPFNQLGDLQPYPEQEVHDTYCYLTGEMEKIGIAYIHVAANAMIPQRTFDTIRASFSGTIILCNGLTPATAEAALNAGFADLVAFGRSFLANPDLDKRIALHAHLNQPDLTTLYTPGAKGYTDYPTLHPATIVAKDEGVSLSMVGDTYRLLIRGNQTKGEFAIIDMLVPPGGGPGPHIHPNIHETFYVQEGDIEFKTELGIHVAKAGSTVFIPKGGGPHAFKNKTDKMAHLLCVVSPAGLDDFFLEVGKPVAPGTFLPPPALDMEEVKRLQAIAAKYGMQVFPPDFLEK
ncbi:oxidoreductase [Flavitalea flava]